VIGRHVAGDAELVNDDPHTLISEAPLEDGNALPDERLKVLFAYCHATLVLETRVALTLGMLGGPTNDQIAGALRVPSAIVAERFAGARAKIKKAGIPFGVPRDGSLPERLADVLATVYLIFNEAYAGDGQLAAEAIRLGRMLAELLPDESEVHGLLALMLLNDGRRTSRYRHGELVLLDDEERNPWDRERVAEGEQHLARARALYGHGAYVLRAEIASVHMGRTGRLAGTCRPLHGACPARAVRGSRAQPGNRSRGSRRPGGGAGNRRADRLRAFRARPLLLSPLHSGRPAPPARTDDRRPLRVRESAAADPIRTRASLPETAHCRTPAPRRCGLGSLLGQRSRPDQGCRRGRRDRGR